MREHLIHAGNMLMPKLKEELGDGEEFDDRWFEGVAIPK
jgi:hypothetical protein